MQMCFVHLKRFEPMERRKMSGEGRRGTMRCCLVLPAGVSCSGRIVNERESGDREIDGFQQLAEKFRGVGAIEKTHEERYRALLKNVETRQVFEKSGVQIWECRNCGHIVAGTEAPKVCPVCNYPQNYFEVRKENY